MIFEDIDSEDFLWGADPVFNLDCPNFLYRTLNGIDPKSEENISIQTKELIKRYCYFYENAPVILCQIVSEMSKDFDLMFLKNRIMDSINLSLNDKNIPLREENGFEFITFVEEAFLGEKPLEKTKFYKIMDKINSSPHILQEAKMVFERDVDLINDPNMRVLIELMKFLVNSQHFITIFEEKWEGDYAPAFNENSELAFLTKYDCLEKSTVLNKYLEIVLYQNKENGLFDGFSGRTVYSVDEVALKNHVRETLVGYNLFTGAFCDTRLYIDSDYVEVNKDKIPTKLIQEVHYKYHDELPWDMEVECISDDTYKRPNNTKSCGNRIRVNEDLLFTIGNNAYQICPECGYIVMVPNVKKYIFERVKKRCEEDKDYLHRKELVSELIALGGEAKVKRK